MTPPFFQNPHELGIRLGNGVFRSRPRAYSNGPLPWMSQDSFHTGRARINSGLNHESWLTAHTWRRHNSHTGTWMSHDSDHTSNLKSMQPECQWAWGGGLVFKIANMLVGIGDDHSWSSFWFSNKQHYLSLVGGLIKTHRFVIHERISGTNNLNLRWAVLQWLRYRQWLESSYY